MCAMASYTLPLAERRTAPAASLPAGPSPELPEGILLRNALWFCRLRWLVLGLFAGFGLLGLAPGLLARAGLRPPGAWPFIAAAVLLAANVLALAHARGAARHLAAASTNLWAQIINDLVVLTYVVHHVGSLETAVGFAYLFHIVLSCIFFPRRWSFLVTMLACGLYLGCVALEEAGSLAQAGIYANAALREQMDLLPGVRLAHVGWAPFTWIVVWYLAAHLSAEVQSRDRELAETNRRLLAAQEERRQHMLRTTHELKAPFSAIHANVQLLTKGHCGELPAEAHAVLGRISTRCRRLANEIQEMLQLANLASATEEPPPKPVLDLSQIMRWCLAQVAPRAEERQVTFDADLQPAPVPVVEDHAKMLFGNLVSNAVTYSHPGGHVAVAVTPEPDGGACATVADQGIGIAPAKLPRIFEPYYRADEAVRHNRESTGLGLAIVRQVADTDGLRVGVESEPGVGTRFTVQFPGSDPNPVAEGKEDRHGLSPARG
ncbi:MAG TPA: HAMP domain-containing sensor histidine kinase [Planctomycetota bacterium]|nr:HAMP domain-containing sensor histidine kinase [Planctomycetota bacterium]